MASIGQTSMPEKIELHEEETLQVPPTPPLSPSFQLGEKSELNQVTMTPGQERVDKAPSSPPPLPLLPTPIRTLSSQTDPNSDILDDEFKKSDITVKLYQATLSDDWETVERILREDNTWISTRITKGGETVLHVAALAKHVNLVKELVNVMDDDCLSLKNRVGNTALCFAAVSGIVEIAKVMVEKSSTLPNIRGSQEMTPLLMAVLLGHQDMVWYLMSVTDYNLLSVEDGIELLTGAIETDLFEVALHILRNNKRLAIYRGRKKETALHILARKPPKLNRYQLSTWQRIKMTGCSINHVESQVMLELAQTIWDEIIKMKHQEISELICSPSRLLFMAARLGKVEFLMVLIKSYPDILWKVDENRYSIFHIAVIHRHKDIFKLIYEIGAIKDLIATYKDDNGNNMLHLASKLAPPNRLDCVSGAALQMQHELLWFEAVKKIVRPEYIEAENKDHKTPRTLFSEEHEVLRIKGEQWMKKTSESCALVATLIATVVFSAAFQLPGGSNDAGSPILVQKPSFVVFAMANAISLFTSTASILMFLSILTSRYAERDFLVSLPLKLMRGLILLLISITTMIVAFTATFFITFEKGVRWAPIPVALIASVPVILFAFQQFPLLIDIYYSTYNSQSIFHSCKQILFTAPSQQKNFSSEHVDSTSTKIDIPFTILIPDASMDHHALYYACNSFSWRRMTSLIVDPEASDSPTFSSWRTR